MHQMTALPRNRSGTGHGVACTHLAQSSMVEGAGSNMRSPAIPGGTLLHGCIRMIKNVSILLNSPDFISKVRARAVRTHNTETLQKPAILGWDATITPQHPQTDARCFTRQ